MIYNGLGFFVAVITFGSCLAANFLLDQQFGEGYYSSNLWAMGIALFIGGVISSVLGFLLKQRTDRIVVDEQTGERLVINLSRHSFFFIPMHWAGIVIALLGLGCTIADLFIDLA